MGEQAEQEVSETEQLKKQLDAVTKNFEYELHQRLAVTEEFNALGRKYRDQKLFGSIFGVGLVCIIALCAGWLLWNLWCSYPTGRCYSIREDARIEVYNIYKEVVGATDDVIGHAETLDRAVDDAKKQGCYLEIKELK